MTTRPTKPKPAKQPFAKEAWALVDSYDEVQEIVSGVKHQALNRAALYGPEPRVIRVRISEIGKAGKAKPSPTVQAYRLLKKLRRELSTCSTWVLAASREDEIDRVLAAMEEGAG